MMQYLSHEDPNVRFEALIAVQKLMVHNWYVVIHWRMSGLDMGLGGAKFPRKKALWFQSIPLCPSKTGQFFSLLPN